MGDALKLPFRVAGQLQATKRDNCYGEKTYSLYNTAALKLYCKSYCCFTCSVSIETGIANERPIKCHLKVVSATFLLVCFVCLKKGLVKQGKMFFISL